MHQVHQAYFSYGYTEPNKIALPVVHIKPKSNNVSADINTDALGPATYFELTCGPTYVFTRGPLFPLFALEPKERMS